MPKIKIKIRDQIMEAWCKKEIIGVGLKYKGCPSYQVFSCGVYLGNFQTTEDMADAVEEAYFG